MLGIAALSAAVTAGPFFASGRLHHDMLAAYSFFYDNLDSLNRFGEPALWAPHIQYGTPIYFYGLIGIPSLGKPAFVLIGSAAWLLGGLGIGLPFLLPLYIFHFGVLVPFLFVVGVWLVARQILRSRTAIRYALIAAAFSPGVLVNLTDPGNLENTAYGLFCAAAYLRFLARPDAKRFAALLATALLVGSAVNHPALVTSIPMLAALAVATALTAATTRRALRALTPARVAVALLLLAVTAAPSAVSYLQQHDAITYTEIGDLSYGYGNLKAGNPLQYLLVSLPGVVFDWDAYRQPAGAPPSELGLRSLRWGEVMGENYLGLLTLPLALIGLVYGRKRVRAPLLVMLVLVAGVLALFAASPVLAPWLLAFPALRTNNHYSDLLHPGGGFLVMVFAAALGLEAAERRPLVLRRAIQVFLATTPLALLGYWRWAEPPPGLAGFAALMAVAIAVVLLWASRLPRRSRTRMLGSWLLALVVLDVATVAFWYGRFVLHESTVVTDAKRGHTIGTLDADARSIAELFPLKGTQALLDAGLALDRIPFLSGYCRAHLYGDRVAEADLLRALDPAPDERSLGLPAESATAPALRSLLAAPSVEHCAFRFQASGTYNEIRLQVVAEQPGVVLIRDAWTPQWRATLAGRPAPVHRALGAFKAVVVPAGSSELRLRFAPRWIGAALLACYATLAGASIWAWRRR